MKKATNRRHQAAKNTEYMRAMLELRKGSRTDPIPSPTKYKRLKAGARNRDW